MSAPDQTDTAPPESVSASRWRDRGVQVLKVVAGLLLAVLVLVAGAALWLTTDGGRGYVASRVAALSFANGITIRVGRIDGSLFGGLQIKDLAIGDAQGIFLRASVVELDYRPWSYLGKHVDIRALHVPEARLYRRPALKPSPPDQPLLPDLDIDLARFAVDRLDIDPAVSGQRHAVYLKGTVHIANRAARIVADGRALALSGMAGGDHLQITLDAAPQNNRLDMDLALEAPANGLLAALDGRPFAHSVRLAGKGNWQAWNGRLTGGMGGAALADVAITERSGTFGFHGAAHLALLVSGQQSPLFQPATRLDITAAFDRRRARLEGRLGNANFTFGANGGIDFGNNTMSGLKLSLQVMRPNFIATNLSGEGLTAQALLNGSFAAPSLSYGLTARRFGFGAIRIEGLAVSGSAALDKEQWRIPIVGHAAAITGVSPSIAPLLANVSLNGDFAYANGRLLSDNIHLLARGIDAHAVVIADFHAALYTGTLNGRINGYQVASVGIFNLQSNMGLKSGANGYFRLGGHIIARSVRLFNDGLHRFLGGDMLVNADVTYDSNGVASLDRLTVAAPAFRLVGGHGRYGADGRMAFAGNGISDQYGPLALSVSGTLANPLWHLVAARPGVGVGLAHLVADLRGSNGSYLVIAHADSDYGPVAANLAVTASKGPLAIQLRPGTSFSGIALTGRVTQLAAGPFGGTIGAHGPGVSGRIDLSALGGRQRARVTLAAQDASLPGNAGLTVGRALVNADLVMFDRPQVVADVQLASLRKGDLYLALARANIVYRGGAGQVKALVEGRRRYPFHLAINGILSPALWRIALEGRVNGVNVASRDPLQIVPAKGSCTLRPAAISINRGSLRLEGRYGSGMTLHSRLEGVDLALVNAFAPDLGLGGKATGSLDFQQAGANAFPLADARMQITGFTRTSMVAVSDAVNITLAGQLGANGGHAQAIVRRGGTAIGQVQINLAPTAAQTGSWSTRLLAAPLSGGVRYNGPADVLASLAALADQSLKGPIGLAADFRGTAHAPQLTGVVRANQLTYENAVYGTKLTDMALRGHFTNDRLQVDSLTARARDGTISASGFISLSAAQGYPVQLGIHMDNAQLANGQDLSTRASGQITLVNGRGQPATIDGTITLPETHYRIVRQGSASVPTLTGVRRKPAVGPERITGGVEPISSLPSNWRLNLQVTADNKIFVTGMGLDSEWSADLHVGGTSGAPAITGTVTLVRGTLSFAGQSFDLDTGVISFTGGDMTDPEINIAASGTVSDVPTTVTITGSGLDPQIALTSSSGLPQDELMARVLFGGPVGSLTTVQAVQLAYSLNTLRGEKGGLNPLGVLQSVTGASRLRILGADATTGRQTALAAGKYITNNVYVEVITDTRGYTATQLEVSLTKALSVLSQAGQFGGSGVTARYRKRY